MKVLNRNVFSGLINYSNYVYNNRKQKDGNDVTNVRIYNMKILILSSKLI